MNFYCLLIARYFLLLSWVSIALYLRDPDQNGVELYWDKPEAEWPRAADGKFSMVNARIDLKALLAQAVI